MLLRMKIIIRLKVTTGSKAKEVTHRTNSKIQSGGGVKFAYFAFTVIPVIMSNLILQCDLLVV